jgi:acetyl esterase/lipase
MRRLLCTLLLALLLTAAPATHAQPELPPPERSAYDDDLPAQQMLAIYLPQDSAPPYPTVITIHGGGFFGGDLRTLAPLVRRLQTAGYAVVNITYRLVPETLYPAQVEDAFCALAWVSANAAVYGIDPERVTVLGESAGGYLAALLASVDDPAPFLTGCPQMDAPPLVPTAAVLYYPIIDFTEDDFQPIGAALGAGLLEGRRGGFLTPELRDSLAAISALGAVDGAEPPFLLIHGERDRLVPPSQSALMLDRLRESGVSAGLTTIADADHGFAAWVGSDAGAEALAAVLRFLDSMQS